MYRSPSPRASAAPLTGTVKSLRVLGIAALLLIGSTETLPFITTLHSEAPATAPGLLLLLLSQLGCLPSLMRPRPTRVVAPALLALQLLGVQWVLRHCGGYDPSSLLIPGYWFFPIVIVAMMTMSRRDYLGFTLLGSLALLVQMGSAVGPLDWVAASDMVWILTPVAGGLLFGDALLSVGAARDRSLHQQAHAQQVQREQELEASARREAARLLHDHVLHALHALAHSTERTRLQTVELCREAYRRMGPQTSPAGTTSVEEIVRADPAVRQAGAVIVGQSAPLPQGVAQTIADAVHEALNNVTRHARATQCSIEVLPLPGGVQVDVTDDGIGFDPAHLPNGRMGVGRSITQRMTDVGGEAVTTSAPGEGTRVSLRWPRHEVDIAASTWRLAPEGRARRALTRTAWPALATGIAMTALAGPRVDRPVVAMTSAGIALGIGVMAALLLRRRPLGPAGLATLLLTATAAWVVQLWVVPEPPPLDYLLWMAWGSSALVHLVVLSSRPAVGTVVVALWTTIQALGLVWRYGDPIWVWTLSSTITGGAGECAVTLAVIVVARRAAAQEAESAARIAHLRSVTAQLRMSSQLSCFWSQRVTQEALPLLKSVADGELDPAQDRVRERAIALDGVLRDELLLGPDQAPLLAQLAQTRSNGWELTSTLSPEDSRAALVGASHLLAVLGPPTHPGQPVTVSATGDVSRAVIIDAATEQRRRWRERLAVLGGTIESEPDFVRLDLGGTA
ncbi:sensor histidine kinase [Luteococcus sp. Sow4_B9]|uniref:sensor histidine kinase n=1 Tax=Luteococcus sp. Sow4_B9 TaxID=3438792 RepID=UPI003F97BE36